MLDPKLLRSDLTGVAAALARRGFVLDVETFASLEERRKAMQIEADRLRAERNANAKAVGHAKSKGQDAAALLAAGERYFPDEMPDRRYYVPAPRGLEIKIGEALNQRRERDRQARGAGGS